MSPFQELLWECDRLGIHVPDGVADRELAIIVLGDLRIDTTRARSKDDHRPIADLDTPELVDHAIRVAGFTTPTERINTINDRGWKSK